MQSVTNFSNELQNAFFQNNFEFNNIESILKNYLDPLKGKKVYENYQRTLNMFFESAIRNKKPDLVLLFKKYGGKSDNTAQLIIVYKMYNELFPENPDFYEKDINKCIVYGCVMGDYNFVNSMIEKYKNKITRKYFRWGLSESVKNGHKECVELMLKNGADNYDSAIEFASLYDKDEFISIIKEYIVNTLNNQSLNKKNN